MDVENPMTISAGSGGKEKMNVSFTNGTIQTGWRRQFHSQANNSPGTAKINVL